MLKYRLYKTTGTDSDPSEEVFAIQTSTEGVPWDTVWDTVHPDQAVSRIQSYQKEQGQPEWETVDMLEEPA